MSCNRVVKFSAGVARHLGVSSPTLEAAWACGRKMKQVKICPVCRNSFLRGDGGCTKCERYLADRAAKNPQRYMKGFLKAQYPPQAMEAIAPAMARSKDARARQVAASHLTDGGLLDELAHSDNAGIQAAVAANRHTSPQTLAALLKNKKKDVYRAAATNPSLRAEALEQATRQAEANWKKVLMQIASGVAMGAMYGGIRGQRLSAGAMNMMSFALYGAIAMKPYQRYSTLRRELQRRQQEDGEAAAVVAGEARVPRQEAQLRGQPVSTAAPSPSAFSSLTQAERNLLTDGLDIAEAYVRQGRDDYGADVTLDDIARIRESGVQTGADRRVIGQVLDEMEEAERSLPGWFNVPPEGFHRLREKLGLGDSPAGDSPANDSHSIS